MLLRDGRPWIIHGSMGGEIQPQVFAQVVSAIVDGGVDVATAVGAPRWAADVPRHLAPASLTVLESRYRPEVVAGLRERGHEPRVIEPWSSSMGHAHAIEIVRRRMAPGAPVSFAAATDPRSEGLPGRGSRYTPPAGRAALTTSAAGRSVDERACQRACPDPPTRPTGDPR